ncbi:peptidoglycan-recognition protein LA [Drosophila tropicalis]|uniref:peptidoglycan-recognition protein LA n=1 Tax=Drosophila tropicalis TaxID=46794 RepID=UPI0035ABCA0B
MKLLLKVHSERIARRRRATPEPSILPPSRDSSRININRQSVNANPSSCLTRNFLVIITLVCLVLIAGMIITYAELNKSIARALEQYESHTEHLIVERHQWEDGPKAGRALRKRLHKPIPYVLITHLDDQLAPCDSFQQCSIEMRNMLEAATSLNSDIACNFYVSMDGNIFVGRGWDIVNSYANHSICITLMGDYENLEPSIEQLKRLKLILDYGEQEKYLAADYKIIAQRQVKSTKSPGKKVIDEIENWKHYYKCGYGYIDKCGNELGMTEENWNGKQ